MEWPSALPVTAPLFFIAAERFLPNDVNPAGAIYGAACGALGAVALYAAWPTLIGPDAPRAAVRAMTAALTIVAFAQSITWMDVVAGEIVALLGRGRDDQRSIREPPRRDRPSRGEYL
jgi:sodium/potassium/calcium exchanger 6